jgi:uncharacterized protein (UPF0303 family)
VGYDAEEFSPLLDRRTAFRKFTRKQKNAENEYACCGGGFPLTVKNAGVIGTICVSGLPHMEDHKLIVDSLKQYLSQR